METQTVLALSTAEVALLQQALYHYSSTLNLGSDYRASVTNLLEQINLAQHHALVVDDMDVYRDAHTNLVKAIHALEYAAKAERRRDYVGLADHQAQVLESTSTVDASARVRMRMAMLSLG